MEMLKFILIIRIVSMTTRVVKNPLVAGGTDLSIV